MMQIDIENSELYDIYDRETNVYLGCRLLADIKESIFDDRSKYRIVPFNGEEIQIKYHTNEIDKLDYIAGKSDWIDLRSAEHINMKKGDFALISLGVSIKLPDGYEAHICPRSSTYKNFGIIQANSMGIVDQSYCGDNDIWKFPAIALRDTEINVNDRICQFRIMRNQPKIVFYEVQSLGNESRGGFGSTGIK